MLGLIVGYAHNVNEDLKKLDFEPDRVFAVNYGAVVYPGKLNYIVSLHFKVAQHLACLRSEELMVISKRASDIVDVGVAPDSDENSGIYAVRCAAHVGCTGVVLAGLPADKKGQLWSTGTDNSKHGDRMTISSWKRLEMLDVEVRSLSGNTEGMFGYPSETFIKRHGRHYEG